MPVLEIITGQETFPTSSAKMHVFVCTAESPVGGPMAPPMGFNEVHIGSAAKGSGSRGITPLGRPARESAAPGYRDDLGYWLTHRLEIIDGTILKLFGSVQRAEGALKMAGACYLRVRQGARYLRLSMTLTQHDWAGRTSAHMEGEFDILTVDEAREAGVVVPDQYSGFAIPERFNRLFATEVIRQEQTALTTASVVTNVGTTAISVIHPRRNIKIRRRGD